MLARNTRQGPFDEALRRSFMQAHCGPRVGKEEARIGAQAVPGQIDAQRRGGTSGMVTKSPVPACRRDPSPRRR
jgi:hypothetical protein